MSPSGGSLYSVPGGGKVLSICVQSRVLLARNGETAEQESTQHEPYLQGPSKEQHGAEKDWGAAGLFGRAFQQAKRLGEAIDPEAVAQVEQAWKVRCVHRHCNKNILKRPSVPLGSSFAYSRGIPRRRLFGRAG